ncbi:MAG: L-threonylcarbamoyladenylate synthase [Patescibacteria group bacterium]
MILNLNEAVEIIQNGGVVAFPTETVYGLGARADLVLAVDEVYQIKQRPKDNPLICHFADFEEVFPYVDFVPPYLMHLVQKFVPGPLSFRLKLKANSVLEPSTAGQECVVCRVPDHQLARDLIHLVGKPLVGPSANTSGKVSNTSAEMVENDLGLQIQGVLDGGESRVGIESTIIDCVKPDLIRILRPGFISADDLKFVLHQDYPELIIQDFDQSVLPEVVPGMKYKHYSPDTSTSKIHSIDAIDPVLPQIVMCFNADLGGLTLYPNLKHAQVINLGDEDNLAEVAHKLYFNLKQIDKLNTDGSLKAYFFIKLETEQKILASGLGRAIMNRLDRASSQN